MPEVTVHSQDEAFMILVTGGTGGIGSELLRLLSEAGVGARALARNPQKAPRLPGVTWVAGDLSKPETLTTAFQGVNTLFLNTSYYEGMVALQHNAIAAACAAGVTHVVKVSAFAASDHSKAPIGRWHYQVEKELQESGIGWTILRPHHFMQNLLGPGRVHQQGRCCLLGFRRRQDSVHRLSGHCRDRFRHTHAAGTRRQEICTDRKRSDVVPAGCRDHRRYDRQATAVRR